LAHGDVIHAIGRTEVRTVEDHGDAIKSLKAGEYMLEVERNRKPLFLTITFE
jgi:S1-C subfamily serine protease